MEPLYNRTFQPHLLGIKDPTPQVSPGQVASYCAHSGLSLTTWLDDYNRTFVDPTCIIVHIASCFSASWSCSSSAAESSSQGTHSTAQASASTSYGIYHGPFSPHNTAQVIPDHLSQSKPHADLYAAGMSLWHLNHNVLHSSADGAPLVRNIVLVTDSNYLTSCLTQRVFSWNTNGYRNAKGKIVANANAVRWVERLVVGLENNGIGVRFWKVDKKENAEALLIAKKVLEQDELRKMQLDSETQLPLQITTTS